MSTRKRRGRVGRVFWLLAAVAMLMAVMPVAGAGANGSTTTPYPDQSLTGGFDAGHFGDVYDLLNDGDMALSFTFDGIGLSDAAGAHAWAELGVRSLDTWNAAGTLSPVDFNPYWRQTGWAYDGTVRLLAGQDTEMGEVTVTSDATYLYVTYHVDAGWCMTQSHFAVATDPGDLPQTKKGNAIPGQFPYGDDYDPCETGEVALDPIPFTDIDGFATGDTLYFAAHASVIGAIEGCTDTLWQIGEVEEKVTYPGGTELLYTNYADEFNWGDPAGPYTQGPGLTAEKPAFANPFVVGTNLDEEFPYNSNASTANFYATDFDVKWDGDLPFGGELYFSWSPGQSAAEEKVVSGAGFSATVNRTGTAISGQGYFLDTYPVYTEGPIAVGPYATGTHTINFTHTKGDGTFWDWIRLEAPCERYETAWGEGPGFEGKDWSMYFSIDPTPLLTEGSGVWLATDYRYAADTLQPDPVGAVADGIICPTGPCLDNDDKMMLQRKGGDGEAAYDLPGAPPNQWANHAFWFDRDGVDQYQALLWGMINGVTYNTVGVYDVVITLHATSATTGTAYMTVNGEDQGFYVPTWHGGPLVSGTDLYPAGMTFTGDMEHLVVFYGLYGYGTPHSVTFSNITVTQ